MYKILVVEDDETIVQIVKRHLQSWGYEVFQVEDFAHVIQEFVQKDPQLVLLDLKLPFYNGFHWCEEIRKISQVPVLFLSSAADNMNMVMAMSRGADDLLPSPLTWMCWLPRCRLCFGAPTHSDRTAVFWNITA